MADTPTISVITPCYNGERYLQETLTSVSGQTRPPLEVLVVDDGSTDRSAEIAEAFGPPVRVIRQSNRGESAARNQAIAEARGSHLLFLDADDLLHPEALERLSAAVTDEWSVPLMGYLTFVTSLAEPTHVAQAKPEPFLPSIVRRNRGLVHCYLTPAPMVRRVGGFCDELQYFEDWDLWCQLALAGARLVPLDFVGAYYRRHANAQSRVAPTVDRKLGHVAVVERFLSGFLRRPELVERHGVEVFWAAWSAARTARDLGVPWQRLSSLEHHVDRLVRLGAADLRRLPMGRLTSVLGFRRAMSVQGLFRTAGPRGAAEEPAA